MYKIYKTDSKGKLRVHMIYTEGTLLCQESGLLDGKLVYHEKECKGKNVGRANETTAKEQALLEATSKYKKKIDEGYFDTQKEAQNTQVQLPMLAKDYKKFSNKIVSWLSVFAQPKLDGMRCFAEMKDGKCTLTSRKGKPITTMQHIVDELEANIEGDVILDGELYVHGESFQENMKLIKKYREGLSEAVKFHCYDVVEEDSAFSMRYAFIEGLIDGFEYIELVNTEYVDSEFALKEFHKKALGDGYEGTIVRHGDTGYELDKRSTSLLKYKDFIDLAIKLVDVIPADARPAWGTPCFKYKGQEFRAGCRLSHAEREDLLANKDKYIGQTAELRFFEYSDDGIPRFPVLVGFRLDK